MLLEADKSWGSRCAEGGYVAVAGDGGRHGGVVWCGLVCTHSRTQQYTVMWSGELVGDSKVDVVFSFPARNSFLAYER